MEEIFDKDESGYLQWVATNCARGFVVNTDHHHRSPVYPMVHRATHRAVSSDRRGNYTTGRFFKVCSNDIRDLEQWARRVRNRSLTRCTICM